MAACPATDRSSLAAGAADRRPWSAALLLAGRPALLDRRRRFDRLFERHAGLRASAAAVPAPPGRWCWLAVRSCRPVWPSGHWAGIVPRGGLQRVHHPPAGHRRAARRGDRTADRADREAHRGYRHRRELATELVARSRGEDDHRGHPQANPDEDAASTAWTPPTRPSGPKPGRGRRSKVRVPGIVPPEDLELMLANIGISSRWSAIYTPNNGPHAAFLRVQLRSGFAGRHDADPGLRRRACATGSRSASRRNDFFFETGGMIRRILNAGAVAPIEVQVSGRDHQDRRQVARQLDKHDRPAAQVQDTYSPQAMDLPQLRIEVDRTGRPLGPDRDRRDPQRHHRADVQRPDRPEFLDRPADRQPLRHRRAVPRVRRRQHPDAGEHPDLGERGQPRRRPGARCSPGRTWPAIERTAGPGRGLPLRRRPRQPALRQRRRQRPGRRRRRRRAHRQPAAAGPTPWTTCRHDKQAPGRATRTSASKLEAVPEQEADAGSRRQEIRHGVRHRSRHA